MEAIIASAHWFPDCCSFWLSPDEGGNRETIIAALRRHVELMRAPTGGRIRRVDVSPPRDWGGIGFGRVDVYYVDGGRRPWVRTVDEALAVVGGSDGVSAEILLRWRAHLWLDDGRGHVEWPQRPDARE